MAVSAKQVKELRDRTGAGMMDCKKALVESDGDMDAAIEYLQIKGIAKAAKKSGRVAAEGLLDCWISKCKKHALLLEVNCETDFVSRNDSFQGFVNNLVTTIGPSKATTLEEAHALPLGSKSVDEAIKEQISIIGENIQLRRFVRIDIEDGFVGSYIHAGAQVAVIIGIKGEHSETGDEFARDIAMHVAAMKPGFVAGNDIPDDQVAAQSEIFTAQVREEGKPEKIAPKIVEGKINKWKADQSLLDQAYVKDPDLTVAQYQKKVGGFEIVSFTRYEVGEGIEKVEVNLADEVAATIRSL